MSLAGSPFCLVHVPPRHAVFSPISLHLFFKPTISPASLVEPWWLLLVTMIMSSEFCSFLSSSHKAVLHGESEACLVYRKFLSWVHPMLFPLPTHLSLEGKRRFLLVFLLHPSVSLCFHHIIHVHFICHYLKIIQFRQRIWIFNINILGLMFKSFFEM